jgi:fucose 4-O-acetylase-like acetyltransferase
MPRGRDQTIETLRWIAILAVVAHHAVFPERYSASTLEGIATFKRWIAWCVPAFFAISGAFLRPERPFVEFISQRSRRLLVPFLCMSLASFLAMWCLNAAGIYRIHDPRELGFGLLVQKLVFLVGFGPQLYFLTYLFVVSLLVYGMRRFLSAAAVAILLAAALWAQCRWAFWPEGSLGPGLDKVLLFSMPFALAHWLVESREARPAVAWTVLGASTVLAIGAGYATATAWPVEIVAPFWIYLGLSRIRLPSWLARARDRWSPGAVFLWHAPLLLPAVSIVLQRVGIVEGWNFCFSCLLVVPASLLADHLARKAGLGRFLSL